MSEQNKPEENVANPEGQDEPERKSRRDFLRSLGRWSAIIIGGAALGGMMGPPDAAGWINGRGGWVNARGGGGAGWVNRSGGGGAAWVNGGGGGAGWINRGGGGWVNARGGGGGGSWINRR